MGVNMRSAAHCEVRAKWGMHAGHTASLTVVDVTMGDQVYSRFRWVTDSPDARPILGHFRSVHAATVAAWHQGARNITVRERIA